RGDHGASRGHRSQCGAADHADPARRFAEWEGHAHRRRRGIALGCARTSNRQVGLVRAPALRSDGDRMTDEAQLAALRAEVTRQRQAIAELEEQSARLAGLLIDMPKLFAAREPDALIAACAEAARSATGAVFALFVA